MHMVFCTGVPYLKFLPWTVPEIWRGPKILKVGHVIPPRIPLTYFWIFVVNLMTNIQAKFEVSSLKLFQDMDEVPKF